MRPELPTGTATFLFTDIEGSTRLLHALGPERYAEELAEHRRVLREAFAAHNGVEDEVAQDRAPELVAARQPAFISARERGRLVDFWDAVAMTLEEDSQTVP